jgi:hypothetical protein
MRQGPRSQGQPFAVWGLQPLHTAPGRLPAGFPARLIISWGDTGTDPRGIRVELVGGPDLGDVWASEDLQSGCVVASPASQPANMSSGVSP